MCADTKIIASWMVGGRNSETAKAFIADLSERLANRIQLTTDGNHLYIEAVERAFHGAVDYAMLVKVYGDGPKSPEHKYSPSEYVGAKKE